MLSRNLSEVRPGATNEPEPFKPMGAEPMARPAEEPFRPGENRNFESRPNEPFRPNNMEPNRFEPKPEENRFEPNRFEPRPMEVDTRFRSPEENRFEPNRFEPNRFEPRPEENRFGFRSEMNQREEPGQDSGPAQDSAALKVQETITQIASEKSGNWLKKKAWWEQAQILFEKLMKTNNQITSLQVSIIKSREFHLKKNEETLKNLGLEMDKSKSELEYVVNLIDSSKNEELFEEFSSSEKAILDKIFVNESDYKKLIETIDDVLAREDLLSKAVIQLNQLVEECKNYEKHSWDNFKEIGKILDDEKARVLYYGIEADYKNVEAIYNYIRGELSSFINNCENSIDSNINSVNQGLQKLEEQGMNLEKTINDYKRAWKDRQKQKEEADKKKKSIMEKKSKPNKSFIEKIWDWIKSWF